MLVKINLKIFAALAVMLGIVAFTSGQFAGGLVSQKCLQCICNKESFGCKPLGCRNDKGSLSCGYFQIKKKYYKDCGSPGTGWKTCSKDKYCSSLCVQNYMAKYIGHYGCSYTCESYARSHNGGTNGCRRSDTLDYWKAVKKQTGCSDL